MGELRKDYLLDRWVIISRERSKRPNEFKEKEEKKLKRLDPFAPGNEKYTAETNYILIRDGKWEIKEIANKYPAVKPEGHLKLETKNKLYTSSSNYGYHEIIVETPTKKQLWDFKESEIQDLLKTYEERIEYYEKQPGIKYVCVFKNHGPKAGASIQHSHSQIIAYNIIPTNLKEKLNYYKKDCPHCIIIKEEKKSKRKCFENDSFIAFTPYASRFPYEICIYSKKHETRLNNFKDLSSILKQCLLRLKSLNCSYNMEMYYAPKNTNLHFHIEIQPRLTIWAGFEQFGTIINPVSPEDASKFYKK